MSNTTTVAATPSDFADVDLEQINREIAQSILREFFAAVAINYATYFGARLIIRTIARHRAARG